MQTCRHAKLAAQNALHFVKTGSVLCKQPNDYNNNCNKEHEQGNTVHTVHELNVNIPWVVGVTLSNIEVGKNLLPDTLLHDHDLFNKVTKIISQSDYICSPVTGN